MCLGFVYSDMGCLVVEGIHVGTGGKQVRYIRRILSVTSTLSHVEYLKWVCCNLVPYNYISLLIEDILSSSIKV